MSILNKPNSHKLPYKIQKKLQSENEKAQSQQKTSHLPDIYLQSKNRRAKSSLSNFQIISYVRGDNQKKYRRQIRKGLATKMTFQHNQNGQIKILPQNFIRKFQQPIKAIPYSTNKFKQLFQTVKEILGTDFQIQYKDILAADGTITHSSYIFFTATSYQPFSLCCKSLIYINLENINLNPLQKYSKKSPQKMTDSKNIQDLKHLSMISKFLCGKCHQTVLTIQSRSQETAKQSLLLIKKDSMLLQEARQKISMSIIVSSGKFKRMRIDKASQKDITIDVNANRSKRYNPQDSIVRHKSKTLTLNSMKNQRNN